MSDLVEARGHPRAYLNKAFRGLRCAPDLIGTRWYPNSKEWTESMGVAEPALRHGVKHGYIADESVLCLDVGGGKHPRTGAMAALRSRWTCCTVDPNLHPKHAGQSETWRGVHGVRARMQDTGIWVAPTVVVLMCHAHISVPDALRPIQAKRILVVHLECCVRHGMSEPPTEVYRDVGITSAMNTVRIWEIGDWS